MTSLGVGGDTRFTGSGVDMVEEPQTYKTGATDSTYHGNERNHEIPRTSREFEVEFVVKETRRVRLGRAEGLVSSPTTRVSVSRSTDSQVCRDLHECRDSGSSH